jgi:hypothetical protein
LFVPRPFSRFFVGIVTGLPSEGREYVVFSVTLDSTSVPPVLLSVSVGAGKGGAFRESTPILAIKGQIRARSAASAVVIDADEMDRFLRGLERSRLELQPKLLGSFQLRLRRVRRRTGYKDQKSNCKFGIQSIEGYQSAKSIKSIRDAVAVCRD